jgi:pilus assembly protein CpaE
MPPATPEFIAFVHDPGDGAVIQKVVDKNWPSALVTAGGIAEATAHLRKNQHPQALLVDFSQSQDPEGDARALRELAPTTTLIGAGAINDVSLFRRLLAAGIADYLIKPLTEEMVQQAIISAAHFSAGEEKKTGMAELVVMIGSRGGVGASAIAVNTAWILAEEHKFSTALVDLDVHYGSSALALDIEPSPGLREALKNPSRIDSLFVTSALVKATDRLYVMGSEESLDEEIHPDPAAISLMLGEMRGRFQYVVVDLPKSALKLQEAILGEANKIILVSDLSLAGIRDCVRLLNKIRNTAKGVELKLVLNRVPEKTLGIAPKDFERGTDHAIDLQIAEDGKIAIASNAGKTLSAMSGGLAASPSKALLGLRALCQMIIGKAQPQKKPGMSLMGLLGKKS